MQRDARELGRGESICALGILHRLLPPSSAQLTNQLTSLPGNERDEWQPGRGKLCLEVQELQGMRRWKELSSQKPKAAAEEGRRRRDIQRQVSLTPRVLSANPRQPSRQLLFPMSRRSRQNPRTSSSSTAAGSSSPTSSRRYGAPNPTETGPILTCVGNRVSGWRRALNLEPSSLALICPRASGSTTMRRLGKKSASMISSGTSRGHEEIGPLHRDQAVWEESLMERKS